MTKRCSLIPDFSWTKVPIGTNLYWDEEIKDYFFIKNDKRIYSRKENNMKDNISITCTVNGKEVPLSDLSMETIENIRKSEKEPFPGFNDLHTWVKDFIETNKLNFDLRGTFTYVDGKLHCKVFYGESTHFFTLTSWLEQLRKSRPLLYPWLLEGLTDNQIIIQLT